MFYLIKRHLINNVFFQKLLLRVWSTVFLRCRLLTSRVTTMPKGHSENSDWLRKMFRDAMSSPTSTAWTWPQTNWGQWSRNGKPWLRLLLMSKPPMATVWGYSALDSPTKTSRAQGRPVMHSTLRLVFLWNCAIKI